MGKTIIVSSHILTELSSFCTAVGIIEAGKLVVAGKVEEILRTIKTHRRFTVDFLAHAETPRAAAWIERQAGVTSVEADGASLSFAFDATDEDVAALLERLVAEKVRLTGFHEELADLETAFMTLTKGKLA